MRRVLQALSSFAQLSELRGILKYHRVNKLTTSYVPMATAMGLPSGGAPLDELLTELMEEDASRREPFLASLVLGVRSGVPNAAYFEAARKLGHAIASEPKAEFLFWAAQLERLGVEQPATSKAQAQQLGL